MHGKLSSFRKSASHNYFPIFFLLSQNYIFDSDDDNFPINDRNQIKRDRWEQQLMILLLLFLCCWPIHIAKTLPLSHMRARGAVDNFSNNSRCLTETQLPEPTALFISDESEEFRVARNSFLWIFNGIFFIYTDWEHEKTMLRRWKENILPKCKSAINWKRWRGLIRETMNAC